tara:strand:- start:567 stop:872 length:306 start_codon:yes stop_codon:yes gene_type:complete
MNIKLIEELEKISVKKPDRILKLIGYSLNGREKEYLEIIIFKGFSSSTTHPIDINSERSVIDKDYYLSECKLLKAPLSEKLSSILKEDSNITSFLDIDNWL